MHKVYRIYTEDLNRAAILQLSGEQFQSFTLQTTTGYYQGRAEESVVLEIVQATEEEVLALAKRIRHLNGQKSVLVMGLEGWAQRVET